VIVTVCMPWRAQSDRIAAHDRVRNMWEHFGFPVIEADSDPDKPFSVAQARNNAVRRAHGADVIIVADADVVPDIGSVHAALDNPEGVVYPFETFLHIPSEWVTRADLFAAPIDQKYGRSVGGMFVCTPETYWSLGGMDELFYPVWGYEDNAFGYAAETLVGVRREPGVLFSFNHSANRDLSEDNPNRSRHALYRFAHGRPTVMRELIRR
jgi:hypothetical protein